MSARTDGALDVYDAYLFDIDGTLLNCTDAVHYFAFCDTLTTLAGRPMNLDGVVAHGNTDTGILRDALRAAGLPEVQWRPRLPDACLALSAHVAAHKAELCAVALPSAARVLSYLRSRPALVGVATGNLAAIGRAKLANAGLPSEFAIEGFSDGFEVRGDIIANALARARALGGATTSVCVVGDTPADIQAARVNGLDVIAVATGVYSLEELRAHQPTVCVSTLSELMPPTAELPTAKS